MIVYEIPNIEHCDVTMPTSRRYLIQAHEGWHIHLNDGDPDTVNIWKRSVGLMTTYDFSLVEIRATADLPEGADQNV